MIVLAIIELAASYCNYFSIGFLYALFVFLAILSHVLLLVCFKKYLQNFRSSSVIYWMNWNIASNCALFLFYAFMGFDVKSLFSKGNDQAVTLYVVLVITSVIIAIIYGNKLRGVRNDFIGLLKELGIFLSFVIPISELLIAILPRIIPFITHASGIIIPNYQKAIPLIQTILYNVPPFIMILISLRAKKYLRNSEQPV